MEQLLKEISKCQVCASSLPHGIRPVVSANVGSRIAIIGQAPGSVVHRTGIPWDDKSGDRLREWLGVSKPQFYNAELFALIPMGFCYPGKGKSGDLPPRKECAPLWHHQLLDKLPNLKLTILAGAYGQAYYLSAKTKQTLTETVQAYEEYLPDYFPLPHPSPRNNIWLKRNEWFGDGVLPVLTQMVQEILKKED